MHCHLRKFWDQTQCIWFKSPGSRPRSRSRVLNKTFHLLARHPYFPLSFHSGKKSIFQFHIYGFMCVENTMARVRYFFLSANHDFMLNILFSRKREHTLDICIDWCTQPFASLKATTLPSYSTHLAIKEEIGDIPEQNLKMVPTKKAKKYHSSMSTRDGERLEGSPMNTPWMAAMVHTRARTASHALWLWLWRWWAVSRKIVLYYHQRFLAAHLWFPCPVASA